MRNLLFGLAAVAGLVWSAEGAKADDGAIRLLGTQSNANIVVGTGSTDVQATPVRYGYYRGGYGYGYRPWGGYYGGYYRPYSSYYRGYNYGYRPYGSYYRGGYYGYRPYGYWR